MRQGIGTFMDYYNNHRPHSSLGNRPPRDSYLRRPATAIIAETGVDMKMFATAAMLIGWCGLKPRNDVSNGHYKSKKITHGNNLYP